MNSNTTLTVTRQIRSLSFLLLFSICALFAGTTSYGQAFHLFGCLDQQPGCDNNPNVNVISVSNLDTGLGVEISGELTYFPNTSPGGGINSSLQSLGGVRFTNGSLTVLPHVTGPSFIVLDFAFFEPSSALATGAPYVTIASYSGSVTPSSAPGSRSFLLRTFPNGDLNSAVAGPSVVGSGLISDTKTSSLSPVPAYVPPTSGSENIFLITEMTAYPGDVFTFPNSIEVGLFLVPEPSTTALLLLGLVPFGLRRRRS